MKTLTPLRVKPSYWRDMETQVMGIFRSALFQPILDTIKATNAQDHTGMQNATASALQTALRSGRIQYSAGVFTGQSSSAIGREIRALGGKFDARSGIYTLDQAKVPAWVKAEAATYHLRARQVHEALKRRLDEIQRSILEGHGLPEVNAKPTVDALEDGFQATAKKLEVSPTLNDRSRDQMASEYTNNMKLLIKKFSEREITALREVVEKNATEGYRFDALIGGIKKRYGITARHAKFLARQETAIFMSKYHEKRYEEGGVTRYIWSTSHDARVRPTAQVAAQPGLAKYDNHRRLDGRAFAFANPPVVDTAKGRKANPGQDYNCRCVAIPILDTDAAARREYRELVAA